MIVKELIEALSHLPEDMTVVAAESSDDDDTEIYPVLRAVKVRVRLENGSIILDNPLNPSPRAEEVLVVVS